MPKIFRIFSKITFAMGFKFLKTEQSNVSQNTDEYNNLIIMRYHDDMISSAVDDLTRTIDSEIIKHLMLMDKRKI